MVKTLLRVLIFCAVFGSLFQVAPGQQSQTIQVEIAGGKMISAVLTDGEPVPTEDQRVKTEEPGILTSPSAEDSKGLNLIWNFSFRNKGVQRPTAVTVDDVTEDPISNLVKDGQPTLRDNVWRGRAQGIVISTKNLPWLFDSKPTIKVFRFVVRYQDNTESLLYQIAPYPVSAKEIIRFTAGQVPRRR